MSSRTLTCWSGFDPPDPAPPSVATLAREPCCSQLDIRRRFPSSEAAVYKHCSLDLTYNPSNMREAFLCPKVHQTTQKALILFFSVFRYKFQSSLECLGVGWACNLPRSVNVNRIDSWYPAWEINKVLLLSSNTRHDSINKGQIGAMLACVWTSSFHYKGSSVSLLQKHFQNLSPPPPRPQLSFVCSL
jgi:hypothetical protein